MAVMFPSAEWLNELKDSLNADKAFEKAAAKWEGSLVMHVQADELLDKETIMWIDPYHGKVRDAKIIKSLDEEESEFVLGAQYSTWKAIINGEMDSMKAMMKGKIKVQGKLTTLLKQTKASNALIKVQQNMDTVFIDEQ
jgi:putative sterol carrier protein